MANIEDTCDQHKELSSAHKKQSEASVCKAMEAFSAYISPFDGDIPDLVNLASGRKIKDKLAEEILKTDENGQQKFKSFVKERLHEKSV